VYAVWVYLPLVIAALAWNLPFDPLVWLGSIAAGLLLWTPLEYVTHRVVLHRMAPHYDHHNEPTVVAYIFAPLTLSAPMALGLWALLSLIAGSWRRGALVEAGVIAGYLFYEALHVRIHSQAAGGPLLRFWRKHHYYHHFADDSRCYGVTSPLWDYILRTGAPGAKSSYHGRHSDGAGDLDLRPPGAGQAR
jgi:sterol desaturase/sphingolipid hydroxylase (fatty acid hydroxylase superfamily)